MVSDQPSGLSGARILITGATGFIGSHLAARLVRDGAAVSALVRPSGDRARIAAIADGVRLCEGDVTDPKSLERAFASARPDVVFHMAGDTSVRRVEHGWEGIHRSIRTNIGGTLAVLEAALDASQGVTAFVRAGGLEEYGDGPTPYDETQREQPVSPYSASQVSATHYCEVMQRGTSTRIITLRPALVYGPAQSTDFLIPSLIGSCLRNEDFELTTGAQQRDLLYIDDAVEAFVQAAVRKPSAGVINVGHGVQHAIRDIAGKIVQLTGTRAALRVGSRPSRPRDLHDLVTRTERAASLLGWRPNVSLEDGLRRTIEWYRTNENSGITS